jgi:predicted RNase H-like HicB family nuclease
MKLKVVLEKGEDGFIVAHCPSLKGCWSQGKTEQEAIKNIKEAIALYLEPDPKVVKPSAKHKVLEVAV